VRPVRRLPLRADLMFRVRTSAGPRPRETRPASDLASADLTAQAAQAPCPLPQARSWQAPPIAGSVSPASMAVGPADPGAAATIINGPTREQAAGRSCSPPGPRLPVRRYCRLEVPAGPARADTGRRTGRSSACQWPGVCPAAAAASAGPGDRPGFGRAPARWLRPRRSQATSSRGLPPRVLPDPA
jgi:hypothetical protein